VNSRVERNTLPEDNIKTAAKVIISEKTQALKGTQTTSNGLIYWTDGSRLENSKVECTAVWRVNENEQWQDETYHLWKEKEVFDAECYAISEAVCMSAVRSDHEELEKSPISPTPLQRYGGSSIQDQVQDTVLP
jgi:hypothetical protein